MTANHSFSKAIQYVFVSVLFIASNAFSLTTYYLSSAGSDGNNGTSSSTSWNSIAKLNSTTFASGDVINFNSGDTFYGQIAMNQPGVTIGSYGAGAKPVISGGIVLSGWSVYSGSIYVAAAPAFVKDLFSNGTQMTVARYPNTGLMTVTSTDGSSSVSSGEITQGSGYWTGGNLHIRTTDWTYETRPITSSSAGSVSVSGGPEFAYASGWGFYLDNKLSALDAPGEWYCDPSTNNVYFYAPGGVNPSSLNVVGSVLDYGVTSTQSNTTIRGLGFAYQASAAIHFAGSASNVNILSNDVVNEWVHGIEFTGGGHTGVTIDGNTIRNVNGRGINAMPNPQSFTITNNTIRNIGMIPGYGSSGFTGMSAIVAQAGAHNTISRNVIDSIGYIGIRHDGSYNMIENNVITNAMMKLCDGGAIYAWGGTGATFGTMIRGNVIENTPGDNTGVAHQPSVKQGHGIYFDLGCFNMTMENNTVIHAGDAAVFIQYSDYGIVVRNNTFYECAANYYSATIDLVQDNSMGHGANVFTKNVFFPLNNNQPLFRQQQSTPLASLLPIGTLDSNTYCDPYSKSTLFHINNYDGSWSTAVITLAQWKTQLGQDAHSTGMYTTLSASDTKRSLFTNKTSSPMTVTLSPMTYKDLNGTSVTGTLTLQPYSSRILIKDSTATTTPPVGGGSDLVLISPSLKNGGFETAGTGGADVLGTWTEEKSAGTGTIAIDAADAHTGSGSLLLQNDASSTMLVYQPVLTVGKLYKVDFWAKSISGSPSVTVGGWTAKATAATTTSYALYSLSFTAEDTYLRVYNDVGSSAVSIDDLTLTEVGTTALPVEIVSFTLAASTGGTVLNWKTATELNNYGFDIERKDNGLWTKIGFVSGNGTSNISHTYTYLDAASKTGTFTYRLKQIDNYGAFIYSQEMTISQLTDVQVDGVPREFSLGQNYPNPFNPATTIKYAVASPQFVHLVVYDVVGRVVSTLVNQQMQPGNYSVQWNAQTLPSGVYFYRLDAGNFTSVKKLLLQK